MRQPARRSQRCRPVPGSWPGRSAMPSRRTASPPHGRRARRKYGSARGAGHAGSGSRSSAPPQPGPARAGGSPARRTTPSRRSPAPRVSRTSPRGCAPPPRRSRSLAWSRAASNASSRWAKLLVEVALGQPCLRADRSHRRPGLAVLGHERDRCLHQPRAPISCALLRGLAAVAPDRCAHVEHLDVSPPIAQTDRAPCQMRSEVACRHDKLRSRLADRTVEFLPAVTGACRSSAPRSPMFAIRCG